MEHLDAHAIRERLNTIALALTTLSEDASRHRQELARTARTALEEIAVLVTDDEMEEHGAVPVRPLRQVRSRIRAMEERR